MKDLSNWRSVRIWEGGVERQLRRRHWLGLHGFCIGAIVLGVMWASAHLQMLVGSDSLALRYLVTLGVGYLAYLGVLRLWAQAMVGREHGHLDLPVCLFPGGVMAWTRPRSLHFKQVAEAILAAVAPRAISGA